VFVEIINSFYLVRAHDVGGHQLVADFVAVGQTYGELRAHDGGPT